MNLRNFLPAALILLLAACNGDPIPATSSDAPSSANLASSISSSSVASSSNPASSPQSSSSLSPSSSSLNAASSSIGVTGSRVYAINVGSNTASTLGGIKFEADRFASGGDQYTTTGTVAGTSISALYQSERYGTFSYDVPVTKATYSVVLHFVEMYQQSVNSRTFKVAIEGKEVAAALDIYSNVGHGVAYTLTTNNISVSDGALSVQLTSLVHNATLSGIEIYSTNGGKFEEPPAPSICPATGPCKILPLGDSITDGVGGSGGAYRVELFRQAIANNKNITFVGNMANGPTSVDGRSFPRNHQGHSGWSINQIANVVPSPALNSKPNIILLLIGTNDSWVEPNNNGAPAMAQKLGALIDKIINSQPDALLAVAVITPRTDYAKQWADNYVAVIPGVVQTRINQGFNIILVNQYNGFPSNGLSSDKLHPNDIGYQFMGRTWYNAIKGYLR